MTLLIGVLLVALVGIAPGATASPGSRAFRAIVGPADVPDGKATWTRPGTFRTPYALVAAWGLPPSERTGFTKQYRSAGFRVGSLGYVTGSGHSNWVSVAAILRSHAAAVSYIDGMHDFDVAGIGYSVIGDGSSRTPSD